MQQMCQHWLQKVAQRETALDFKQLRSDRGFLVYATQAYPAMKPYLKGFHLSLESWRGGRDAEGWKVGNGAVRNRPEQTPPVTGESLEEEPEVVVTSSQTLEELKVEYIVHEGAHAQGGGPATGITFAVPRFKEDLEALVTLTAGTTPTMRCVWSKRTSRRIMGLEMHLVPALAQQWIEGTEYTGGTDYGDEIQRTRVQTTGNYGTWWRP